jgi:hypothetical protein
LQQHLIGVEASGYALALTKTLHPAEHRTDTDRHNEGAK